MDLRKYVFFIEFSSFFLVAFFFLGTFTSDHS